MILCRYTLYQLRREEYAGGDLQRVAGEKDKHPVPDEPPEGERRSAVDAEYERHVRQPHQIQHTETGGTGEGDARGAFAAAAEPASYISCGDKAEQEAERGVEDVARPAAGGKDGQSRQTEQDIYRL